MKIKFTKLPKSEVQLDITFDEKAFEAYHERGVKGVQQMVEIDGFRKGNASEDAIVKKYGDMIILEEMANIAMRDAYVEAVKEHKFQPVADPKVTINKLAKGNPLELTMVVPVIPEVTLPSYKKLAKDVTVDEKIEVTDKDIDDVIEELRKGRAHEHAHAHDPNHEHKEGEEHNHPLPELNDEFAQSFGPDFKTITDLRSKVGDNMKLEKEQKLKEKRRTAIMEKLIAETKTELPEAIIETELENMLSQMKGDITRYGGTWEEYLTHSKKTEDEIKASWRDDAVKRSMSQIILHKIADAEKLQATNEEIEVELVRLLASMQDVDEQRAKSYLYQALTNEKVLKFLEEDSK
jgi:FKBP-type peptidyl-prolyl cis-trans isomerase (trigger factor)